MQKIQAELNIPSKGESQFELRHVDGYKFPPSAEMWFYALKDALELAMNELIKKHMLGMHRCINTNKIHNDGPQLELMALGNPQDGR